MRVRHSRKRLDPRSSHSHHAQPQNQKQSHSRKLEFGQNSKRGCTRRRDGTTSQGDRQKSRRCALNREGSKNILLVTDNSSRQCLRCGTTRRHKTCQAMGATYDYSGKLNHDASVCIAKSKAERFQGNRNQRRRNSNNHEATLPRNFTLQQRQDKRVTRKPKPKQTSRTKHAQNQHSDDSSSSDDDCYLHHLKTHHTSHQNKHRKTCTVYINNVEMQAEPDTALTLTLR